MSVVLLHLSDIHIKSDNDPILDRGLAIAACTFSSLPFASHVFIVVTGDIAFSGETFQYALADKFFHDIQDGIKKECGCLVIFVMVPGNHDCNFQRDSGVRKLVVKNLEEQESPNVDDSIIETCTAIQQEYFTFRDALESCSDVKGDPLWRTSRFEVDGKTIEFDSLNVSWVSKLSEDPGKMHFPIERYEGKLATDADVRILMLHHPLNWFSQSMYRKFRTVVRKHADIIFSGHEHQGNVGIITEAESDASAFVEGGVLQGERDITESAFNVVVLDLDAGQFSSTQYQWSNECYGATEVGSWAEYRNLPAKRLNPFSITDAFQTVLDDPGAYFRHPGRTNIILGDIYVYPDMQKVGNGSDKRRIFVSASTLLSPAVTERGVLIEGDEKVGCTSLLHQLFQKYYDRGFVPVLLKGKDLRRPHTPELDALVKKAVAAQYGKPQVNKFEQLSKSKKILLLDDFDDGPIKAVDVRASLLCALRKRFGHLVVTVGDMFEMREMLEGEASSALMTLDHYKMLQFGHVLRGQLITRWLSLGADGTVDESTMIARRDLAEKLMNSVMSKALIPPVPLYLLTLLQSIDAGRSGDFKESALGYYYQYLLTESLQSSGVRPDKLTEVFQYAVHLAWEYHLSKARELSEQSLREFNLRFSKKWHTVDFKSRLEILVNARVLSKAGDEYAFRYPYIFYFLKGKYISESLSDASIREYVSHCCKHLYVRDHANTVLFLAHHTNDAFVINATVSSLQSLFKNRSPLTFEGDTVCINRLIEEAPKLGFSGGTATENRNSQNELADQLDDGHDGMAEAEENSDELSLIAQMTMLFKTMEILGQVLKNQYAKIQRTRKGELLEELFDGPLRALSDFFEFLEKNPDSINAEIEASLRRQDRDDTVEERKAIAKKVVGGLIQLITFGFVMRAAQSANAESLQEDVRDVVKRRNTMAYKLIEVGILLDSPKRPPHAALEKLYAETGKDIVAGRLLHMMVLNRLYMFPTSEKDMQWLHEELKIDLGVQHAISYQERKRHLLH